MKRVLTAIVPLSIATLAAQTFEPTVENLKKNYRTPEWFRDAKFGIYMHWGVYSVAEEGEWYARQMYQEGSHQYRHHLEHYGHPSEFGYKDLIPLWKAEKFDPDAMVALFKKAGAKYFAPCAVHHDNFDLWDSSEVHQWNSVQMGPKKDLIGMFKEATLKHGLRFGVTTHLERTSSWFQTNKGADTKGPKKGVPYDGNDPEFVDFYLPPDPEGDSNQAHPQNAPEAWREHWKARMKLLIDKYQPDHLYVDGGVPFYGDDQGQTGLDVIAYYYNQNAKAHDGVNQGVMCIKNWKNDGKWGYYWEGVATLDIERHKLDKTHRLAWQTDDSIGPWGYKRGAKYQSVDQVVDKLISIVAMNGNLLLNVPPRADGTLDERTVELLLAIGKWMDQNGEAIYATRPWTRTKEGAVYFTAKPGKLYALATKWPEAGKPIAFALEDKPKAIRLLGGDGPLEWSHRDGRISIPSPASPPNRQALAFEIALE